MMTCVQSCASGNMDTLLRRFHPPKWLKIEIRFFRRIRGVKAGSPHQDQSSEGVSTLIMWPLLVGFSSKPYKQPHLSMPPNNSLGEICCVSPISFRGGLLSGTSLPKEAHVSCARKNLTSDTFSSEYRSEEHTSELQSRLHLVCR